MAARLSAQGTRSTQWSRLSSAAELLTLCTLLAAAASVVLGIWFVVRGVQIDYGDNPYTGVATTYQLRPAGVVLIALGVVVGPALSLLCWTAALLADERARPSD